MSNVWVPRIILGGKAVGRDVDHHARRVPMLRLSGVMRLPFKIALYRGQGQLHFKTKDVRPKGRKILYFRHSQSSEQRIALPHPDLNPKKGTSAGLH